MFRALPVIIPTIQTINRRESPVSSAIDSGDPDYFHPHVGTIDLPIS